MEAKYTPGPWSWENIPGAGLQIKGHVGKHNFGEWQSTGDGPIRFFELTPEGPVLLAYERWVRFEPNEWNEMQAANAQLIAAAPDLLAECKAARLTYLALARNIDVLVKLLNDAGLPSSWLVLELSKLEKVSAAITKAEAKP